MKSPMFALVACLSTASLAVAAGDPATPLDAAVSAIWDSFEAGHWPESTAQARTVLQGIDADDASARVARGGLLRMLAACNQADAADAVKAYDATLAVAPPTAAVLEAKGLALRLLDREADALKCFDQSLAMRPDHAATLEARGLARMALHENDAALADLVRAVELAPDAARYRITLASMHRRLGDVPAATAALEEAVRLARAAGDDCRRGEALVELRRYREAVEALTAAISRDRKNLRALSLRCAAHEKLHDARAALADAREIARLDPADAGHWLRIGAIERDALHDEKAALASFDHGLEIAPRFAKLLVARGQLKFGSNDYDGAQADLDAAAATNPDLSEVHSARAAMHSRRREFAEAIAAHDRLLAIVPRNPAALRDRAHTYQTSGDEKRALEDCDAALALLPSADHAGRGRIQREAKRWPESIEAYDRAIAADPTDARLFHDRAWVHNETNEYVKAAADCRAGLAIDPDDDELQEEMAYALKGAGNHDEAIAFFTKLIDRNPRGDAGLYLYRGDARMAKKDHAVARDDYQRACDLDPATPQHWTSLGRACEAADDLDAAGEAFRRAAALPPRDPSRGLEPGRMFYRKKKYDLAAREFERATKEAPTHADAWDWLGVAYREAGDLDKALACHDEAARLEPGRAHFHRNRAAVLRRQKRWTDAIAAHDRAIAIEPAHADSFFWRGKCREALEDVAGAEADFKEAVRLAPDDNANKAALASLQTGPMLQRFAALLKAGDSAGVVAMAGEVLAVVEPALVDDPATVTALRRHIASAVVKRLKDLTDTKNVTGIIEMAGQVMPVVGKVFADDAQARDTITRLFTTTVVRRAEQLSSAHDLSGLAAIADKVLITAEYGLGKEPELQETFRELGAVSLIARLVELRKAQDFQGSTSLADRVLPIAENALVDKPEDLTKLLMLVASSQLACGNLEAAERLARRAVALAEKCHGPEHAETGAILGTLVHVHDAQGRYADAIAVSRRLVAIDEKVHGPEQPVTAQSLCNLAQLLTLQGKYAEAEPLLLRALSIREKALGPDHPDTGNSLNALALLYAAQGDNSKAYSYLKRRLEGHLRTGDMGADDEEMADSLHNLAMLGVNSGGNLADAEALLRDALAIREKVKGPEHPGTATTLDSLGSLLAQQGRYAEAESLLTRALNARTKALGSMHPDTAVSLNSLAHLATVKGMNVEAESLFRRAATILEKALGPDHPRTATSLSNLAAIQIINGREGEALPHIDQARRVMRRHVARVLPSLSAAEQVLFLQTQDEGSFHGALTLGLLPKSTPQIAALSAGWLANGKAVAQEAASQQIILARQSENPATKAAVAALERVRADLAKLSQMTPAPNEAAAYRAKLAELQAEEQRFVHEIGGQLAALDRDEPWAEIDAIRKNLPAGTVLVDIARFGIFDFAAKGKDAKWQPARYAAWIVPPAGKGDVTILDLGPAKEIDAAVAAYREAIDAVQKGGFKRGQDAAEQELKITAAPLTQKVFQPIVVAIGSATEIVLSPDGALWLVPWQALPLADGSYAIEKYSIRTVTSARDLVPVPVEPKGSRGGSVVVADPAFDAVPAAAAQKPTDTSRSFAPSTDIVRKFGRLPNTRTEALASKSVLTKLTGSEPKVLLGPDASEAALRQAAVRPRTVVLATHGFFKPDQEVKRDDAAAGSLAGAGSGSRGATRAVSTTGEALEDPLLRCGLALAGANVGAKAAGGDDGILTGAEIVGLDLLGTDLVVLSACETGVGTVKNGEGVAGLRQAFQIAGANSVVATLWQVPDAESAQIMAAFYANLAAGQAPSKALREAQLGFIKARREDRNYEAAHPYLWAAYGVTGR